MPSASRPILFSAPMVRALIAGRKTQTRRLVKPQPPEGGLQLVGDTWLACESGHPARRCPYGRPGDTLWVKETFAPNFRAPLGASEKRPYVLYRANGDGVPGQVWRPSIFMRRTASRLTLEVTAIRVERLQAITADDAAAEGVESVPTYQTAGQIEAEIKGHGCAVTLDWVGGYRALWEQINGPASWALNPYVWVITFRRLPLSFQ